MILQNLTSSTITLGDIRVILDPLERATIPDDIGEGSRDLQRAINQGLVSIVTFDPTDIGSQEIQRTLFPPVPPTLTEMPNNISDSWPSGVWVNFLNDVANGTSQDSFDKFIVVGQ